MGFKDVLVVFASIVVLREVSPPMPLFLIPHINKKNHVYIVFKFSILVYLPTIISL